MGARRRVGNDGPQPAVAISAEPGTAGSAVPLASRRHRPWPPTPPRRRPPCRKANVTLFTFVYTDTGSGCARRRICGRSAGDHRRPTRRPRSRQRAVGLNPAVGRCSTRPTPRLPKRHRSRCRNPTEGAGGPRMDHTYLILRLFSAFPTRFMGSAGFQRRQTGAIELGQSSWRGATGGAGHDPLGAACGALSTHLTGAAHRGCTGRVRCARPQAPQRYISAHIA